MSAAIRPMLACSENCDPASLKYPVLGSYKLDGLRCLTTTAGPQSRSGKPIPNAYVRAALSRLPPGLDGELGVWKGNSFDFRASTSAVRSEEGEPHFEYHVFDLWGIDAPFYQRANALRELWRALPEFVKCVDQEVLTGPDAVWRMFDRALLEGHEGLILRAPGGPYKHGRSTMKEGWMLKLKPWETLTGVCVGVVEEMHNTNAAEANGLGYAERSSMKAGLVPTGRLGALLVKHPKFKNTFEIGTGFTDADKAAFWARPPIGESIEFKHALTGGYDKPRHAVFLGVRWGGDVDCR